MKKDATCYDAARRKRNPGVATPDEVKALQAQYPSLEGANAGRLARSLRKVFVISCPFCAANNTAPLEMRVSRKAPDPAQPYSGNIGMVVWLGIVGVSLLVHGWPPPEWAMYIWVLALIPCQFLEFLNEKKQRAKFEAAQPEKYVCNRCGLEGDFNHFHRPACEWAPGDPEAVIIDEILD